MFEPGSYLVIFTLDIVGGSESPQQVQYYIVASRDFRRPGNACAEKHRISARGRLYRHREREEWVKRHAEWR